MLPPFKPDRIPWIRYWAKHDGKMHLDDLGYLLPPSPDRWADLQPDVYLYEEVASRPFLALLGETGSGKTDAIVALGHALAANGEHVNYIALDEIDSSEKLRSELESSQLAARKGTIVTLLFDQFEVSGLGAATYKYIAEELERFPLDKVRGRFGCRSGSWTLEMERRFGRLLGKSQALEIAPLTRVDVLKALSSVSNSPAGILVELEQRELVPLLTKPVTLRLIIRMIESGENLSNMTVSELYRKGIRRLLNPTLDQGQKLEEKERNAVARRIAAISVFCRKHLISSQPDDGTSPVGTLHIVEAARGSEPTNEEDSVKVNEAAVREVIQNTGLFNCRATGVYGWVHASFAEYLAAEYLQAHRAESDQIRGLLSLKADGNPIIPELQGVVGWLLTNGRLPFGDDFIKNWPTTVLRSDVQSLADRQKEMLVESLLEAAEQGVLDIYSMAISNRLPKLKHPNLCSQIKRFFQDRSKSVRTRELAMTIAADCMLSEIAMEIASVALDKTEDMYVRSIASHIVEKMNNEEAHKTLRPLIDPGDDELDDAIRGAVFRALWPKHLNARDLFKLLPDPRNEQIFDLFALFLFELPGKLCHQDLIPALEWACARATSRHCGRAGGLVDEILLLAFKQLDEPKIIQLVGDILIARAKAFEQLYPVDGKSIASRAVSFRKVIAEYLSTRVPAEELREILLWARPSILEPEDSSWLLTKIREGGAEPWVEILVTLLQSHPEIVSEYLTSLDEIAGRSEQLRNALSPLIGPVDLASTEAAHARKHIRRQSGHKIIDTDDSEAARRQVIVNAVLNGETDSFINLPYGLGESNYIPNLTVLPRWQQLTMDQRKIIQRTAREFLITKEDGWTSWFGTNSYPNLAMAGFRALRLFRDEAGSLEELPAEVWKRWVGAVMDMPFNGDSDREAQRDFLRMTACHAKAELFTALKTLMERDTECSRLTSVLALFAVPWDEALVDLITDVIQGEVDCKKSSLLELLHVGSPVRAEDLAWKIIRDPKSSDDFKQHTSALLYRIGSAGTRNRLHLEIFGKSNDADNGVIRLLATAQDNSEVVCKSLSDSELARLFIWVEHVFPTLQNERKEVREPKVARFRNDILSRLRRGSSAETVRAIEELVQAFPSYKFLRCMKYDAEERLASAAWKPPTSGEFLDLIRDRAKTKRFVATSEELQATIVESLERFAEDLVNSETPLAEFLWNDCLKCKPRFRPKDENALSNLVKRHLEFDLAKRNIIVNREVEVQRAPTGMGKRTDIYVRATDGELNSREAKKLTVVIETKKCSNRDMKTALKRQLVDEYLKPLGLKHGIYLVGRFGCTSRCCKSSLQKMQSDLDLQATGQLPEFKVIAIVLDTALSTLGTTCDSRLKKRSRG